MAIQRHWTDTEVNSLETQDIKREGEDTIHQVRLLHDQIPWYFYRVLHPTGDAPGRAFRR
jgi:hypothetical protein